MAGKGVCVIKHFYVWKVLSAPARGVGGEGGTRDKTLLRVEDAAGRIGTCAQGRQVGRVGTYRHLCAGSAGRQGRHLSAPVRRVGRSAGSAPIGTCAQGRQVGIL
jgi:hypothetical protein